MGLYLCIFEDNREVDGVEVGGYDDFAALRDCVTRELEGGPAGSRFPTFILHSDSDGVWTASECERLRVELDEIADGLKKLAPVPFEAQWQQTAAEEVGLVPQTAYESFIDVDGELLFDRILGLVAIALERRLPILFQ